MNDSVPTVAVTRPEDSAAELVKALEARGARVAAHPTTAIGPPPDPKAVESARARLHDYGWIVVTSGNGVKGLLEGVAREIVAKRRFAVVGRKTAAALQDLGGTAHVVAADGRTLAEQLADRAENARFLVARGDRADEVLPVALREAGARVDELIVYSNVAAPLPAIESLERALLSGAIDVVAFAAGSAVTAIEERIGSARTRAALKKAKIAALGKTVVTALKELELVADVVAEKSSANALADAAMSAFAARRKKH
jgi:uroporphyrinogen-III synthase